MYEDPRELAGRLDEAMDALRNALIRCGAAEDPLLHDEYYEPFRKSMIELVSAMSL